MFAGRSAVQMAEEYVAGTGARSQAAALWAARALRRLLPARARAALLHATALHYPDTSLQVNGTEQCYGTMQCYDKIHCNSIIQCYGRMQCYGKMQYYG
jgi:hypothetical protein